MYNTKCKNDLTDDQQDRVCPVVTKKLDKSPFSHQQDKPCPVKYIFSETSWPRTTATGIRINLSGPMGSQEFLEKIGVNRTGYVRLCDQGSCTRYLT